MRKTIAPSLLILINMIAFGQTALVTGTVNDQKGRPVPFAFIYDSQHPYATYADSTGVFSLKADPSSSLIATASNYLKAEVKINNPSDVKIVMANSPSGNSAVIDPSLKNIFRQEEGFENMTEGSFTRIGTHQENIHGSRFLFEDWVHGYVVGPKDSIRQNDTYLFNYDKMDGNLIFATGGTAIHLGIKKQVKEFKLFDGNGKLYVFEDVPAIDDRHYTQVLASGSKYKIYKSLSTKFVKSDYSTNGITSHGNNYDEFVDENAYYVAKLPDGQPQKLSLKKKAIKAAFAADADKANKFLSDNDSDIDDAYLEKLGEYMNQ
ncbi:MAG TPA: hypothetical protein VIM16_15465 [Mucilaginibacter sp.]|jgi:hypothetical protein